MALTHMSLIENLPRKIRIIDRAIPNVVLQPYANVINSLSLNSFTTSHALNSFVRWGSAEIFVPVKVPRTNKYLTLAKIKYH
jgi:hypothetical protein